MPAIMPGRDFLKGFRDPALTTKSLPSVPITLFRAGGNSMKFIASFFYINNEANYFFQ
jgi:hypothetical protein